MSVHRFRIRQIDMTNVCGALMQKCRHGTPPVHGHSAAPHGAHTRPLSMVTLIHFDAVVCWDYCILKRFHNFQFYLHLTYCLLSPFSSSLLRLTFFGCARLFPGYYCRNEQKHTPATQTFLIEGESCILYKYCTNVVSTRRASSSNAAVSVPRIGLKQFINFYN